MTPLDTAFAALETGGDDALRQYYVRFAAAELFVPLKRADVPETVTVEGQVFALAFDTEARLQSFAEGVVERAMLSGRGLAAALAEQGAGVGVNLGVAETAMLLPPDALEWILEAQAPVVEADAAMDLGPPMVSEMGLRLIDGVLAAQGAVIEAAVLVQSGGRPVLLCAGVAQPVQAALASAVAEALMIGGSGEVIDLGFTADPEVMARAAAVGLRFEMPEAPRRGAPGADPMRPPKLR